MNQKEMVRIARALGDPTRLQIYDSIAACDQMFCGQIVEKYGLTPGTVTHHLKVLNDAKLIESRREGQFIFNQALPQTLDEYRSALGRISNKKKNRRKASAGK